MLSVCEGLRGGELPEGQPQEASSAHKQRSQQRVLEAERRGSFPHCTLGEYHKHSSEIWNIPQALGRSQGSTHFQPHAKNEKVPGSCCTNSRTHTNLLILTWVCAPYLPGTGHVTNTHAPTFTHTCAHTHTPPQALIPKQAPSDKVGTSLSPEVPCLQEMPTVPTKCPGVGTVAGRHCGECVPKRRVNGHISGNWGITHHPEQLEPSLQSIVKQPSKRVRATP